MNRLCYGGSGIVDRFDSRLVKVSKHCEVWMPSVDGRRATLAAVAREAGVSLPTVSKVVNGRDDVSEETRARIEQLLAVHQYVGWGQGRRKTAVRSICLVFDSFQNPYSMEISRGVMQAAAEAGTDVSISLTSVSTPGVTWADRVIRSGPVGLILVTSELSDTQRAHFTRARLPLVLIDPINLPGPEVISIGATNWTGAVSTTAASRPTRSCPGLARSPTSPATSTRSACSPCQTGRPRSSPAATSRPSASWRPPGWRASRYRVS